MKDWIQLTTEPVETRAAASFIRDLIKLLTPVGEERTDEYEVAEVEAAEVAVQQRANAIKDRDDRAWATAIGAVFVDLAHQGWAFKLKRKHVFGKRPLSDVTREALRHRLLVRRDEQLAKSSVQQFVRGMEQWKLYRGQRVSVISLLRDGAELAASIEQGTPLENLIDPYIQFAGQDTVCELTGLRTQDIWRYFRHTWSSPYESVPGRSLQFIVRDRAAASHPVIGIGALSSAAVRLGPRDRFIGWDTDIAVEKLMAGAYGRWEDWARQTLRTAIDEIYKVDFIADGILPADESKWTAEVASDLAEIAAAAREEHHRLMMVQEYKAELDVSTEEKCVTRATMPLFRSKRALELSKLVTIALQMKATVLHETHVREILERLLRIARSKTVGTEIVDLTVCGAIAPYSHLGGGKLVAMLAVSPEVVREYRRRYAGVPGIISSSMAGRPMGRPANLCYVGTTSLYGRRPNQYDRLAMPAETVGGKPGLSIRYEYIRDAADSRTQGVGTFHFASKTLKGLELFVSSRKGGWRANNLFGEGTSPKLRGLRDGLAALGLDADHLLVHGIERCMYGVKLAENLDRYLLSVDEEPEWIFADDAHAAPRVSAWWASRWARPRASRTDVLASIKQERLAYPIRHKGRLKLPERDDGQGEIL